MDVATSNEAKEILNISKASNSLPLQYGPKSSTYLGEEIDFTKRDIFCVDLCTVLNEERVCRRNCLLTAEWLGNENCTVVDKIKGSLWQRFGHTDEQGRKVLHPEEALFLVDQGSLELQYNGTAISLQEAFEILLPCLPSLEYYKVFAYLNRAGYRVQRWKPTPVSCTVTKEVKGEESHLSPENEASICPPQEPHFQSKGAGAILWGSDPLNQPLIRPEDAVSQGDVMHKLQIIPVSTEEEESDDGKNASPHFNVYNAKSKSFKKTSPGQPLFAILVCSYDDQPPCGRRINSLLKRCHGTPLKCAVVGLDAVTILSVFDPGLPVLDPLLH